MKRCPLSGAALVIKMNNNVIVRYLYDYPQLSLPISEGQSYSANYLDYVRRGILPEKIDNPYMGSKYDEIRLCETPLGDKEVLVLGDRRDFIRFVQALGHRCEPVEIPDSVGAMTIFGVVNWRKFHKYKAEYFSAGGDDRKTEFKVFTSDSKNYKDTVMVVSYGPYSNVQRKHASWLEESLSIRIWHELTHLVCRTLYSDNKNAIRDEVVADMMGMLKTYGEYDRNLAKDFLGIEGNEILEGGRLWHYIKNGDPEGDTIYANNMIDILWDVCNNYQKIDPFEILDIIERERIGIEA